MFRVGLGARKCVLRSWKERQVGNPTYGPPQKIRHRSTSLFWRYLHWSCLLFPCSCKMNYIHYSKANFVLAVICNRGSKISTVNLAYYEEQNILNWVNRVSIFCDEEDIVTLHEFLTVGYIKTLQHQYGIYTTYLFKYDCLCNSHCSHIVDLNDF